MSGILLLLILEIMLFGIAFLLSDNDIMAPSVMMCSMFIISTSVAIANVRQWNIDYSLKATLILFSGILAFMISEFMVKQYYKGSNITWMRKMGNNDQKFSSINTQLSILIFFLLFNIVISYWYFLDIQKVVGILSLDPSSIFAAYRRIGIQNKAGDGEQTLSGILSLFLKIVKASGYASLYIIENNILSRSKKKINMVLLIAIAITSLIPSIMVAGRADILKYISCGLVEYYILLNQREEWKRKLSWKYVRVGLIILVIGIPAFYYSLGYLGRSTDKTLFDYSSIYLGSSIELFDLYVKSPTYATSFGEETLVNLIKIFKFFGLAETSKSYNLEFRWVGSSLSNVYTFFRRPLHDFGLIGMYFFTSFISIFFAWMYYGKIKWKEKSEKTSYWILLYGYFYYWIVSSSILQYSGSYISAGTVQTLLFIIIVYKIFNRNIIKTPD